MQTVKESFVGTYEVKQSNKKLNQFKEQQCMR